MSQIILVRIFVRQPWYAESLNHRWMKQVTGASGFLGSHIVDQLLEKGYYVKAWAWMLCWSERWICWRSSDYSAARGKKAEALRVLYADNHSIEIVEISDIVHGQFQEALVGVDAVIHTASPLPGRASSQEMLNVRGSWYRRSFETNKLNILLLVVCHRRFYERFTASREGRGKEVCCYGLDSCRDGWSSHSKRHGLQIWT